MESKKDTTPHATKIVTAPSVRFAANDIRLSPLQWLIAATLIVATCWLLPRAWQIVKPLHIDTDYRLPYSLGNDYWTYQRICRATRADDDTILLVGDSVLWGHYVDCDGTLSSYLNHDCDTQQFANLAVDGIHPVALSGLIQYFGSNIRDRRVIINCNLLWISSPRHDLSSDKESSFNHPTLVPQFVPRIPCYKASVSERLGIAISRQINILNWADHLRIAYYNNDPLASWTIEHPYANPWGPLAQELPPPNELPSPTPDVRPWSEKMIRPLTPEWVPLDQSLQWRFFRQTVRLLQDRGNRVFVLIGPLNEHMLTEAGLAEYETRKQQVITWHAEQGIPCFAPPALPSNVYADLSHPVSEGYAQLAKEMLKQESFQTFLRLDE